VKTSDALMLFLVGLSRVFHPFSNRKLIPAMYLQLFRRLLWDLRDLLYEFFSLKFRVYAVFRKKDDRRG
jgi:hypothetical protein